jgi:hypothetical protein
MRFKNRLLFLIYHIITILFLLVALNDYKVINLYQPQGQLSELGEDAFNFINSTKYTQSEASKDIQIILTSDTDITQFPGQGEPNLDRVYTQIIKTSQGADYTDPETKETEFIEYEEVREEYCTMLHADASASRYGMATAIQNLLNQKTPPKLILLDYIFVGTSTHCPEYDDQLKQLIATHPEIIVLASAVRKESQNNNLQNMDPSIFIRSATKHAPNLETNLHDSMIFPFFKDIYTKNPNLNNLGSGNILVEKPLIMEGRMSISTTNYTIPTVSKLIADHFKIAITDEIVSINWRDGLYDHKPISLIIRPVSESDKSSRPIVVFGSNLTGKSADKMYTPLMEEPTPGVYVQATMIDNIINNDFVERAPEGLTISMTVLIILLVYISFFGIIVNMVPQQFFLSSLFRSDLIKSLNQAISGEVASIEMFLIFEGIAIAIAWVILYFFNYYVDIVAPVVVGSIVYGSMLFIHHIVTKILIDKKSLLREFEEQGYTMYFIKHTKDYKDKRAVKVLRIKVRKKFGKSTSIVEFFPFNNTDIFGFQTISKYYWWVSKKDIAISDIEMDNNIQKVKCSSDFDTMSAEMRKKMSTFWQ